MGLKVLKSYTKTVHFWFRGILKSHINKYSTDETAHRDNELCHSWMVSIQSVEDCTSFQR